MADALFRGTASYYAQFRPAYPAALLDDLAADCGLDGTGQLLDLGCGTGHLAIALRPHFTRVVAVDTSEEMLNEARRQAAHAAIDDITWLAMPAEEISSELGLCRLITIGRAFHWMRQIDVLRRCLTLVEPDGWLAILGDGGSVWNGTAPWQRATVEVIQRWLGRDRRAGAGAFANDDSHWSDVLTPGGWRLNHERDLVTPHVWTIDSIIGLLYSSSFCRREYLGERSDAFEDDLRATLLALDPAGRFTQPIAWNAMLARPT